LYRKNLLTLNKKNMKKFAYFFSFLFFSFHSYSQVKGCGSSYDFNSLPPSLQQSLNNLNFTPTSLFRTASENQKSEAVIMIPVVVHVVHRNDEQNISDAVIRNQIEILNNDFRLRNVDRTNTPSLFAPLAADTRIQFYLACRDPQGNPHSGIIRKRTAHTNSVSASANRFIVEDNTVAFDSESGSNSWDNTKYLNIYVADFYAVSNGIGDRILGVGHFPHDTYTLNRATPNSTRSNVVSILQVDYKAFGSGQSYLFSGSDFGRTATHEVGHWLELKHIFAFVGIPFKQKT
jgi:Pregnancy-associated plasma protein-A